MATLSDLVASTTRQRRDVERRHKDADVAARAILDAATAAGRSTLTPDEDRRLDQLIKTKRAARDELDDLDDKIREIDVVALESAENDRLAREVRSTGVRNPGTTRAADRNPLAYTSQSLDALQAAIDGRAAGRFDAASMEQRAALATSTYGAPRVWGANVLDGPRLLHVAAGVPLQPSDAVLAQYPVLTLPSATTSVGENVTLSEFAASTAGSTTLGRFGRFTDISTESGIGTDAGAIVAQHQIGVAKDLDNNLIGLVNTSAGAAVGFTADVPAAIRSAMAKVIDATAAPDPSDLVVLVHPDNAALLQSVTPTGGQTIAEAFQNFSGALVFPSSAVPTGFMLVANLRAGARYFEAQGVMTQTDLAPKTGTLTIATSVIAGYGIGIVGCAVKVDVVTP